MIIRPVEKADLYTFAKIKVETWNNSYKGIVDNIYLEKMDYKKTADKWLKNFNNENFIVAVSNGQIVGFCRYGNRIDELDRFKDYDSEIYAIYITTDSQRQGIGKEMIKYASNELKKQNKNKVLIWCLKDNFCARKFYEKINGIILGYKKSNIGEKYYDEIAYGYFLEEIIQKLTK